MRPLLPAVCVLALLSSCAGCRSVPRADRCTLVESGHGPPGSAEVRAELVVEGLEIPWSLAFLPGGDLLVTERPGRVRLVQNGALVPDPVATVEVDPGGEGGLQGLALHPDFAQNRQFFLYFTVQKDGAKVNRLERWILAEDARSAVMDKRLLDDLPGAQFHHGGRIRVGPDRMLYVSVGDAREPDLAQDPASPAGKLLRLTLDGQVPGDNPVAGSAVFLSGLRNSQGFDWLSPERLVVTDHGPSGERLRFGHDRITVASPGDNLGWPETYGCEVKDGFAPPVIAWKDATPPGGSSIYRGDAIPLWRGSLLVGVLGARHLQRVRLDETGTAVAQHEVYFAGDPPGGLGRLRDVVMGPDGHLYVTTSNCDGRGECPSTKDRILRIVPAP
jgi:glucose/arabinose dehydrogenase